MPPEIRVIGVEGMPEVQPDDDLGVMLVDAAQRQGTPIETGDVVVVTQKIVSKSEGRVVSLEGVVPSALAIEISEGHRRDPRHTELILRESKRIVRMDRGTIISETHHGFNCANAGIDASNLGAADHVLLLPKAPDQSAKKLRAGINQATGKQVGVIISDSWGRPWRLGTVGVAIGVAGLPAVLDLLGQPDIDGRLLQATSIAIADELAAAASILMGQANEGTPVIVVRGLSLSSETDSAEQLVRPIDDDVFR